MTKESFAGDQHPEQAGGSAPAEERIDARFTAVRRVGAWTRARRFDVHALRSSVQLDLRSQEIPEGDLEVHLDSERSSLKLRVPQDAVLDTSALHRVGRTKFHDRHRPSDAHGRVVRITGELRHAEIRVARGGAATLEEATSPAFVEAARTLYREGVRLAKEHDAGRRRSA